LALQEFFRITGPDGNPNPTVDFGYNIRASSGRPSAEVAWSDVLNAVRDAPGVRKVGDGPSDFLLNGNAHDLQLALDEFPVLSSIELVDGDSNQPL
jgi:hypothetical protein